MYVCLYIIDTSYGCGDYDDDNNSAIWSGENRSGGGLIILYTYCVCARVCKRGLLTCEQLCAGQWKNP